MKATKKKADGISTEFHTQTELNGDVCVWRITADGRKQSAYGRPQIVKVVKPDGKITCRKESRKQVISRLQLTLIGE